VSIRVDLDVGENGSEQETLQRRTRTTKTMGAGRLGLCALKQRINKFGRLSEIFVALD